jgi:hypothetical protein
MDPVNTVHQKADGVVDENYFQDLHKQNRDILFDNEKFLLSILQAVAAAVIIGAISQFEKLTIISGLVIIKLFISLSTASLFFSVVSAFSKHEYKKWDVKAPCEEPLQIERQKKAGIWLRRMRLCMCLATVSLCLALLIFIWSLWEWPSASYTLYRNSVLDTTMRIHIATFDTKDGGEYNLDNCNIAKDLFQNQQGVKVRYWCEKGSFKKF